MTKRLKFKVQKCESHLVPRIEECIVWKFQRLKANFVMNKMPLKVCKKK